MIKPPSPKLSMPLAVSLLFAGACAIERDLERDGGVHPSGFDDKESPDFHGAYLRKAYLAEHRYPLGECRQCHGDDYAGGAVGTSCVQSGCHTKGVEDCGTCHDGQSPPKPASGGHAAHLMSAMACADCHTVPKDARSAAHPDGKVEVTMTGLALSGPTAYPKWDAAERRCTNTYCHGAGSPAWESAPGPLGCDSCHGAPPASHARFHVATAPEGCASCHPIPGGGMHLNGAIDFVEPACNTCHGEALTGAPPPALDGSMSASSRGVGAHVRHLDATLADRIGRPAQCDDCHLVPAAMRAEGHLDDSAPADVRLFEGTYDASTGRCVVACHWESAPGPSWTDTTGAPRACDACHGFPPVKTRSGNTHPQVQPSIEVCRDCHHFEASTHVDGHVDFLP